MRVAIALIVLAAASPVAAQPAPPAPRPPVLACAAPKHPVYVFTENLTPVTFDLCASYHRATAKLSLAKIPPGHVTWRIRLDAITNRARDVNCRVNIDVYSQKGLLAHQHTNATVAFTPKPNDRAEATADCIDVVIEELVKKLEKWTATTLASGPLPPPLKAPPPPPPPSSLPVPPPAPPSTP